MQCPKCGAEQSADNASCCRCGIVFAKYDKYHPRADEDSPAPPPVRVDARLSPLTAPASERPESLLFPATPGGDWLTLSARGLLWAVLLVWGLSLMFASVESGGVGASFGENFLDIAPYINDARTSHLLGALIMGLALLWGARLWWRQWQYLRVAQPGTPR